MTSWILGAHVDLRFCSTFLDRILRGAAALFVLSAVAHASTDNFVLTGDGFTATWSLPSSPVTNPQYGAGGYDAGFFVVGGEMVTVGSTTYAESFQFISGPNPQGFDLLFSSPGFSGLLAGPTLYAGPSSAPTFKTGTFNLSAATAPPSPSFVLTITPATGSAATPEPSSLVLLATGLAGLASAARVRLREA